MPIWIIYLQDLRGMSRPIATGYINRRIPSDQRATVLSLFQLSAALMMAMILPQVGRVADTVNFQASFGLLLLILVAAGDCSPWSGAVCTYANRPAWASRSTRSPSLRPRPRARAAPRPRPP